MFSRVSFALLLILFTSSKISLGSKLAFPLAVLNAPESASLQVLQVAGGSDVFDRGIVGPSAALGVLGLLGNLGFWSLVPLKQALEEPGGLICPLPLIGLVGFGAFQVIRGFLRHYGRWELHHTHTQPPIRLNKKSAKATHALLNQPIEWKVPIVEYHHQDRVDYFARWEHYAQLFDRDPKTTLLALLNDPNLVFNHFRVASNSIEHFKYTVRKNPLELLSPAEFLSRLRDPILAHLICALSRQTNIHAIIPNLDKLLGSIFRGPTATNTSQTINARRAAAFLLRYLPKKAFDEIISFALIDQAPEVRKVAFHSVTTHENSTIAPHFEDIIAEEEQSLRLHWVAHLSSRLEKHWDEEIFQSLKQTFLFDPSRQVRWNTILAIMEASWKYGKGLLHALRPIVANHSDDLREPTLKEFKNRGLIKEPSDFSESDFFDSIAIQLPLPVQLQERCPTDLAQFVRAAGSN